MPPKDSCRIKSLPAREGKNVTCVVTQEGSGEKDSGQGGRFLHFAFMPDLPVIIRMASFQRLAKNVSPMITLLQRVLLTRE